MPGLALPIVAVAVMLSLVPDLLARSRALTLPHDARQLDKRRRQCGIVTQSDRTTAITARA